MRYPGPLVAGDGGVQIADDLLPWQPLEVLGAIPAVDVECAADIDPAAGVRLGWQRARRRIVHQHRLVVLGHAHLLQVSP